MKIHYAINIHDAETSVNVHDRKIQCCLCHGEEHIQCYNCVTMKHPPVVKVN